MLQVNLLDYVHAYRVGLILKISNEKKPIFESWVESSQSWVREILSTDDVLTPSKVPTNPPITTQNTKHKTKA